MPQTCTAEDFSENRFDLPDSGRFSELIEGRPLQFVAPDEDHGRTIMNLTREISAHIHDNPNRSGYACFDLGLIIQRTPDTVLFPSLSYYEGGRLFAESDKVVTDNMPRLVVDIASTADRRKLMEARVLGLLNSGIESVWIADPASQTVHIYHREVAVRELSVDDSLVGSDSLLPGFEIAVVQLFAQPTWWK